MKNIKFILALLIFFLLSAGANAQNCNGDNIRVYKGANGCGCHCQKECVTPADLPTYLANGWNTTGCWNCCKFKNWVDADTRKTSLDEILPQVEQGLLSISFTLAAGSNVKIEVMDMSGRHVATLVDEYFEDLENELILDNKGLSAGAYLVKLEAGDACETKRIAVMN